MPLSDEVSRHVERLIKSFFYDDQEVADRIADAFEGADAPARDEVLAHAARFAEEWQASMSDWPEVTDVDRVAAAFDALYGDGIAAYMNMGEDLDDAVDQCAAVAARDRNRGYCFFHHQDMLRAIEHGVLMIGFGPADASKEATDGVEIGRRVADELKARGLTVSWDGSFEHRVEPFTWQYRG
ncbi:MAG: hypothetical protein KC619_04055 [Myxococcales bacterium]|nr:hypothetical protein [Myxococcales bacterium]